MNAAINAALWVVGKALSPVTDGLLESWASSTEFSSNMDALKMELLYAQGMLDNAQGRDIRSPALRELLHMLQELAYGADDALDELDYFRIQDELHGTYHAADLDAQGLVDAFLLNARHTAIAATNRLKPSSPSRDDASSGDPDDDQDDGAREISSSPLPPTNQGIQVAQGGCMPKVITSARRAAQTIGKHFPCYSSPLVRHDDAQINMSESSSMAVSGQAANQPPQENRATQTQNMEFYRVKMSDRMREIVERLVPLCAKVSTVLDKELLGSVILKLDLLGPSQNHPNRHKVMDKPKTTPKIVEPGLYGRDDQKRKIVDSITHGEYCADQLTVLPLVGPGGIGKTTLTKHICKEMERLFTISVWVCVSLDFNADRLAQEIAIKIPKVKDEKENASVDEQIEQRLKSKRLLLVLDDIWTYHEDEWNKLIAPLRYTGGEKGNVVIVTTRIPEVASMVRTTNSSIHNVERLGPKDIMSYFEVCVFGDGQPWEDHLELQDVGSKIVKNLKGYPLAAKTVGRLLRKRLTLDHWRRIADSREWELENGPNDIMPSLKLSYDYLPFHLQQCFSCCGLFPEDYEFGSKELVHLWIGLDILHSRDQNERIEDVGLRYLDDLVNHGFFKKTENGPFYVIHDLLHELAVNVSSYEYLSICSSNVRSVHVPLSVRHLSIIVDNTSVSDTTTFKDFQSELSSFFKRLGVQNLRTLMLFGEYHGSFAKIFRDLFREARALRTIFLSGVSYSVEDVLPNFSKLVHLRYLRIKSTDNKDMCLPSNLFISYHLQVLDLEKWGGSFCSMGEMTNLVKLRHFLVPENNVKLHSSICNVGKLKFLEELRRFEVGKETEGFELSQLGKLARLGGSLGIYNLEKVQTKDKAKELKLKHKNHIHELQLEWANKDPPQDQNIIENLAPHENVKDLCIRGHGGAICPSWLDGNLSVKNLESLCLSDVSWKTLPPLGELGFIDDLGAECQQGLISTLSFQCLKKIKLVKIPRLRKWVGNGKCHWSSLLEVAIIQDCPELVEFPFSHLTCHQEKQEENITLFPKLRDLKVIGCPKLLSLPPIPWTPAPCSARIEGSGSGFEKLSYSRNYRKELSLNIKGGDQNCMLWNGVNFHNLADLEELKIENCPPLPLIQLQRLKSLKILRIQSMRTVLLLSEDQIHTVGCQLPAEHIIIEECDANGEELTQLLSHFPKLAYLYIDRCGNITGLGVQQSASAAAIPASPPSSSASIFEHAHAGRNQQQTGGEDELASAAAEGLLLLPSQLQTLDILSCDELRLLPDALGNDSAIGGLQSLSSLRSLYIWSSPKFLSSYSSSASSRFPFPNSLQMLFFRRVEMSKLDCLSNLVSLGELMVIDCGDLRGEDLWPLVTQGRLTQLSISETPRFFTGLDPSLPLDEERRSNSSKLKSLYTDDIAGVLTLPICSLLSSSLTKLTFSHMKAERFTDEQEDALHLLNALEELEFLFCVKLQHLPAGLAKLTNLKRLPIRWCQEIRSLPKDGLPSSLQKLVIGNCPAIESLPKDGLPSSLQKLVIDDCPAIKSLPKDGLPSSLRELHLRGKHISEELKRQCRKLRGTVPIIKDYK